MGVKYKLFIVCLFHCVNVFSQIDSTKQEVEEDYSIYENVNSNTEIKIFCSPKVFDLSPNRFVSVGYDYIHQSKLSFSPLGNYKSEDKVTNASSFNLFTHGLRLNANIPVISKTNILWQIGGGYIKSNYDGNTSTDTSNKNEIKLNETLINYGLTSLNINSTLFIPLNDKKFLLFQIMGEQNGNYNFNYIQPNISNTRLSTSALYGKRPHDRFQWAIGVSRTYRGGELNYIPVVLYNYTSVNRKWGTEILFPARAAYRRKFNSRSILLAGYELEGTSYRLYQTGINANNMELRRSELRVKLDYQRQLKGFVWVAFQMGIRHNVSYNVDQLGSNNKDFFRCFTGTQKYLMLNEFGLAPYANISINLVSP